MRSIILTKRDRGEADQIVVFLARELGWTRGLALNAKRSRVRFGGHLEPLSLVDLTLRARRRDDLVVIDEAALVTGFLNIRAEVDRFAWASHFLELASIFQPEGRPDSDLFDFLLDFLSRIDREGPDPLRLIVDRVALLAGLGFGPRFDICPLCGKPHKPGADAVFRSEIGGACHRECAGVFERGDVALSAGTLAIIRKALDSPDDRLKRLRLNKAAEEELRAALAQFTVVQRGDEIKSLSFLQKLGLA